VLLVVLEEQHLTVAANKLQMQVEEQQEALCQVVVLEGKEDMGITATVQVVVQEDILELVELVEMHVLQVMGREPVDHQAVVVVLEEVVPHVVVMLLVLVEVLGF
tara:strand:- start:157 stop:471 length:315 start_codon:yes stop_codon:yes gene_type:complete